MTTTEEGVVLETEIYIEPTMPRGLLETASKSYPSTDYSTKTLVHVQSHFTQHFPTIC